MTPVFRNPSWDKDTNLSWKITLWILLLMRPRLERPPFNGQRGGLSRQGLHTCTVIGLWNTVKLNSIHYSKSFQLSNEVPIRWQVYMSITSFWPSVLPLVQNNLGRRTEDEKSYPAWWANIICHIYNGRPQNDMYWINPGTNTSCQSLQSLVSFVFLCISLGLQAMRN